jgi:hypothetical protein
MNTMALDVENPRTCELLEKHVEFAMPTPIGYGVEDSNHHPDEIPEAVSFAVDLRSLTSSSPRQNVELIPIFEGIAG